MKTDVRVLNIFQKLSKILGIIPTSNVLFSSAYLLLLSAFVSFGTVLSYIDRFYLFYAESVYSLMDRSLTSIDAVISVFFMLSCFFTSLYRRKNWWLLLDGITKTEEVLSKENVQQTNIWTYISYIALIHIGYLSLQIFEIFIWWDKNHISQAEYIFIMPRIIMYYKLFITLLILCITTWLRKRYIILNKLLIKLIKRNGKITIISQHYNKSFTKELHQIKTVYASLHQLVDNFNKVFGWKIFFMYVSGITVCLQNFSYMLYAIREQPYSIKTEVIIASGSQTMALLVRVM